MVSLFKTALVLSSKVLSFLFSHHDSIEPEIYDTKNIHKLKDNKMIGNLNPIIEIKESIIYYTRLEQDINICEGEQVIIEY